MESVEFRRNMIEGKLLSLVTVGDATEPEDLHREDIVAQLGTPFGATRRLNAVRFHKQGH